MDKYIAMCDCEEIQEQWKPNSGSRYIIRGNDRVAFGIPGYFEYRNNYIWLPRQENIQEMWKKDHPDHEDGIPDNWTTVFIDEFHEWAMAGDFDKSLLFAPMDSLQIAFYMYEIYKKTWTEKGWS